MCVCVYMYVYMYIQVHVYIYVYVYICICFCIYICIHVYIHFGIIVQTLQVFSIFRASSGSATPPGMCHVTLECVMCYIGMIHPKRKKGFISHIHYRRVPGHRNHVFDPASVFLSTHWLSQHPACQRCFCKPWGNCHPSQRVSTPPIGALTL